MAEYRRKAKDICVKLSNAWDKWLEEITNGKAVISKLANLRIKLIDPNATAVEDLDFDLDRCRDQAQTSSDQLCNIYDRLVKLNQTISAMVESLGVLTELLTDEMVIFAKMTIVDFKKVAANMGRMLSDDLTCRDEIMKEICQARNRDTIMACVAAWVHSPYIANSTIEDNLNRILIESGAKNT